jgi:DNA-binding Lrp family transcriptional regulator
MAKASWHQTLAIHPAAELFPEMTPDELKALGADIIKNGLTSPVVLWQGDRRSPLCLIDGRSRLDAIEISTGSPAEIGPPSITAGKDFLAVNKVVVLDAKTDPWAYVISANIRRRHLGTEDKDRLIVQLLKADPTKSNRQVAKLTDTSHPHVAKVREQAEKTGDVETVTTSIDSRGRQQPTRKSRVVKLTPETIQLIKKLTERGASREKIAETIGVTVNSLQTACSRLGISLRPPRAAKAKLSDEIGSESADELARLRARVDELVAEKGQLEIKVLELASEIAELRRPASEATNDEAVDADAAVLGNLLKGWDRASAPVRERFMARTIGVNPAACRRYRLRRTA